MANQTRGNQRRVGLHEKLRTALATVPTPEPDHADTLAALQPIAVALAELGADDREVLHLAAWEELTAPEIAVVLGIPATTVRTRLHRARNRLRAVLDAQSTVTRT
jgi:RNA polymerase sigma-70 factor (ECF subfamily)